MTNLRKAAQAALTALEQLDGVDTETEIVTICVSDEIDALRAALAEDEPTCKPALQVPSHKPTGWVGHRDQYAVPVLFNPYTGEPRDVRDVQTDPQGVLIVPPGKVEMVAALTKHTGGAT